MSAREVIKGRMEYVTRKPERRAGARGDRRTRKEIRAALKPLGFSKKVEDIVVKIGAECRGAVDDVHKAFEQMKKALEYLQSLAEGGMTCVDAATVREVTQEGLKGIR